MANTSKGTRGNVDGDFIKKLKRLLKIVMPGVWRKESLYILVLTVILVARTFLSIKIADINGVIVQSIVKQNYKEFLQKVR